VIHLCIWTVVESVLLTDWVVQEGRGALNSALPSMAFCHCFAYFADW
jgi:hypothetical protein